MLPSLLFKRTVAFGAILEPLASSFTAKFQPALAVAFTFSNWLTFTASVASLPAATLVIVLPPLFKPLLVKLTVFALSPVGGVIVTPLPSITVLPLLPAPLVNVALVKSFNVFANLTVSEPSL
ncbi:Uncharacterised protein [Actinobacillus equuli]|nr:Uncharacterised protein [Actinobacillus equuli]